MSTSIAPERRLPLLVELDSEGTVLFLKWNEEALSQSQTDLVGRNFFSEVASINNALELQEYFYRFDTTRYPTNNFLFNCKYEDGSQRVRIMLARLRQKQSCGQPESVLMYIKTADE